MLPSSLRTRVIERAENRCEYCRVPQSGYEVTFHIDHITASQHRQDDDLDNLALCCPKCNRKKGPNLAGIDPDMGSLVPLFHPRRQLWTDHFRWNRPVVVGISPTGRATIAVLDLNSEQRLRLRQALIAEGLLSI